MIKVTIRNNVSPIVTMVEEQSTTVRSLLDANGIDYSRSSTTIDGVPLRPGDMDETFENLGVTDGKQCFLCCVVKMDNAR